MPWRIDHAPACCFLPHPPPFQQSRERSQQRCIALVGTVKRPADFGERQRAGIGEVPALPTGLEFLLKVEERTILARIAKTAGQQVQTRPQKGVIRRIDIAQRGKTQTHDISPLPSQVFNRACQ